jgi:hypothetical protein
MELLNGNGMPQKPQMLDLREFRNALCSQCGSDEFFEKETVKLLVHRFKTDMTATLRERKPYCAVCGSQVNVLGQKLGPDGKPVVS